VKIYTKTGDTGNTSLVGGERTEKHDLRVWAYGSIDEANSSIGVSRSYIKDKDLREILLKIQRILFEIGAELASLGTKQYKSRVTEEDITFLENTIDKLDELKPSQNGFIIPGGTVESAHLDVARTDVRRAERYISELKNYYQINENILKYVNRLSDAIYVIARYIDYKDILKQVEDRIKIFKYGNEQNIDNIKNFMKNKTIKSYRNELISKKTISRETAQYITEKCMEKSFEIGIPMVICISDFSGNIITLQRMDDALLASIEIAVKKAYTTAVLKMSTGELMELSTPKGELYGINNMNNIVTFGGGFPLKIDGEIVGSIGVSGGSVEQDTEISKYGVEVLKEVFLNGVE
jgi:cob(I)alamin adenosyltransferase